MRAVRSLHIRRESRPYASVILLGVLFLAGVILFSACGSSGVRLGTALTATPTLTLTPTFFPTLTPTPLPLGSAGNPFVIGIVSETEDAQIAAAADQLGRQIAALTGKAVIGKIYPSYTQLLDDMNDGKAHIAWTPPLTYIYASQRGLATVALLTNHFGVYAYGTQFLANVSSKFTPYYDPISGLSSADAATALAQFKDMRPCYVEPQSASGYILAAGLLLENQISNPPAVLDQTHTAVVRSLYIKGICDFGATFAISGDPRTGSAVQSDLPDVMNHVLIIWRSDADIPNLSLSLLSSLSEDDRQTLTNAFIALAKTADGKTLLSLSAGNYQIDEIKPVTDKVYDPLRLAVKALGLDLQSAAGK